MSSETKWTKGPWACHPFRAYVVPAAHLNRPIGAAEDALTDLTEFAQEICLLHWPDRHRPEAEVKANAHLIAAAPDLYEALEAVTNCLAGELAMRHINLGYDPAEFQQWLAREYPTLIKARAVMSRARGEEPAGGADAK